jgi:hypothetical protein
MKPTWNGLCIIAIVLVSLLPSPLQAQTLMAGEVTVTGTVLTVAAKAAPGMIAGSHLLLSTPSGVVDASLGRFDLQGKGAVEVAAGRQVEATGVIKRMMDGKPVLLVRTLKAGGEIYLVRNQHGFPISPQARERARQSGRKGEAQ